MVKIFKEKDQITVVFPRVDGAEEAIEKILTDVYGKAQDVRETEVEGLISKNTPKADGVQVIETKSKTYTRTNQILKDKRNPFSGKIPYFVFKEIGISAMLSYRDMRLGKSETDLQISRELFGDFKKYLREINTEEYLIETDLEEIKKIISVISTTVYPLPMQSILNTLGIDNVETFLNDSNESQIRSAAAKVINDTIKFLK